MRVAVSSCLLGIPCKYNGSHNRSEELLELLEGHTVIALCPEVLGGLPIPRPSCEIVDGIVQTATGESKEHAYQEGAKKALAIVKEQQAELVILQPRSPSCGVAHVYDGTFTGVLIKGSGRFAQALKAAAIPVLDMEDLAEIRRRLKSEEMCKSARKKRENIQKAL